MCKASHVSSVVKEAEVFYHYLLTPLEVYQYIFCKQGITSA